MLSRLVKHVLASVRIAEPHRPIGSCWLWRGAYSSLTPGAPSFTYEGDRYLVHDILYRQEFGFAPPTRYRGTHCGVPGCVNPAHDARAVKPSRIVHLFGKETHQTHEEN
jgi:hypothetical protein